MRTFRLCLAHDTPITPGCQVFTNLNFFPGKIFAASSKCRNEIDLLKPRLHNEEHRIELDTRANTIVKRERNATRECIDWPTRNKLSEVKM